MERRCKELAQCKVEALKKTERGQAAKLKVAANLDYMYGKQTRNMLEQYALAKRSGFTVVEGGHPFDYPLDEVVAAKEKAGVEHVMINMYEGKMDEGELGFAAIPGKEDEFCDGFQKLVEYAKALNCRLVHIVCGQVFSPTPENDEVCFKNLKYAVEILEREDLVGLIECINWVVEPGYYFDSFRKCVDMIEKINSPNLKLLLDIYHLQYCNGNLTCNLKWLIPYTGHIQISQIPGRHEPGSKGEMDYDFLFQLLRELGYTGYIGLEYLPAGNVDDGLQWFAEQGVIGYEPK